MNRSTPYGQRGLFVDGTRKVQDCSYTNPVILLDIHACIDFILLTLQRHMNFGERHFQLKCDSEWRVFTQTWVFALTLCRKP